MDRARLQDAEAEAAALRQRDHGVTTAYRALADRLEQRIGDCPACHCLVTGRDLIVAGHCPACSAGLTSLLAGSGRAVDQREFLLLVGAIGLLLGIAPTPGQDKSVR